MRIHIADIPPEGAVLELKVPPQSFSELTQLEADGDCRFESDIYAHLEIRKVVDIVEVEGRIETKISATCSRCLEAYKTHIRHPFAVDFTQQLPEPDLAQEEIALSAEDLGLIYYKGDTIDFHDAIQEQVILSLPVRPLCREECRGLCHTCGENLNEGDCNCRRGGAVDPRLAVLKNLTLSHEKKSSSKPKP